MRLRTGWLYLVAMLDWYSRYVVSWMLDETLEIGFVLDAIAQARTIATPAIWNTDQGSHFTSPQVTEPLLAAGVQISMDGRGRAYDNIFTERLWRSVKYEQHCSSHRRCSQRHSAKDSAESAERRCKFGWSRYWRV